MLAQDSIVGAILGAAFPLIMVIAFAVSYGFSSTGPQIWRNVVGFFFAVAVAWFGVTILVTSFISLSQIADAKYIFRRLTEQGILWALIGAAVGTYKARRRQKKGENKQSLPFSKMIEKYWLVITLAVFSFALWVPGSQNLAKLFKDTTGTQQDTKLPPGDFSPKQANSSSHQDGAVNYNTPDPNQGTSLDAELALMDRYRPGWRQTVQSQHFNQWLSQQSSQVQIEFNQAQTADQLSLILVSYERFVANQKIAAAQAEKQRQSSRVVREPPEEREARERQQRIEANLRRKSDPSAYPKHDEEASRKLQACLEQQGSGGMARCLGQL